MTKNMPRSAKCIWQRKSVVSTTSVQKKKDKSVSYKTRHTHAFAFELIAQYIAGVANTQRPINLLLYNQLIYYISLEAGRRLLIQTRKKNFCG